MEANKKKKKMKKKERKKERKMNFSDLKLFKSFFIHRTFNSALQLHASYPNYEPEAKRLLPVETSNADRSIYFKVVVRRGSKTSLFI